MRIIHTSDLHLNSPLDAHLSPSKVRERRAELFGTLCRLADEATRLGAELMLICGDLFDSDSLPLTLAERVVSVIESHPDVQFLYLPGNHERNVLAECGLALPKNLKIFDTGWCYYDHGQITVAARRDNDSNMFSSLSLHKERTNIVMLHAAVTGGTEAVDLRAATDRCIDYMALGHYHSFSETKIDDRGVAVYCGTPEGRGYDECGQKGYVLIEENNGRLSHTFVPFAKRTVRRIKVDISDAHERSDIAIAISSELSPISADDIVCLELVGAWNPEINLDLRYLSRVWEDRFFHFELYDKTESKLTPDEVINDKSLRGEFIRLCMEKESSGAFRDLIIEIGLAALRGEHAEDWQ